jgi:hypothetical protein
VTDWVHNDLALPLTGLNLLDSGLLELVLYLDLREPDAEVVLHQLSLDQLYTNVVLLKDHLGVLVRQIQILSQLH